MGIGEEGAKAIGSIVEGLKAQPLCLSMVLLNGAMIALFAWALSGSMNTREMEHRLTHETQKQTQELLARCRFGMQAPATQGSGQSGSSAGQ